MRKKLISGIVMLLFLTPGIPRAQADGTVSDYFQDISGKFGRGLVHTVGSVAELPCTISKETQAHGASGIASGFGIGTVRFLRRLLYGVTQVVTFMIPMEESLPAVCKGEGIGFE